MLYFLDGGDGNLESIQTMGIVNAMKTGNVTVDMTIAMLIPLVIGFVISSARDLKNQLFQIEWMKLFRLKKIYHERIIRHSTITSLGGSTDLGGEDVQNDILIKSIQMYLNFNDLLKLKCAELELKQMGEKEKERDSWYDYYNGASEKTSLADTLSKYKVVKKPMKDQWFNIGKYKHTIEGTVEKAPPSSTIPLAFDVEFMLREASESMNSDDGHDRKIKSQIPAQRSDLELHFRSIGEGCIDTFISQAYRWYLDQLRTLEDNTRYLYELVATNSNSNNDDDSDGNGCGHRYKRYKLSDEKTFDSLFFSEKDNLLKVVNHFTNKTGKYAIKGYPHKLGLLLHGPPGTGKTSLIKALAERTKRSIVNVPLSRITTNAELASLIFDEKYHIAGERVPVTLGFKDVIYVMEDVDAVSRIVQRRDGKKTADVTCTEELEVPIEKSLWSMMLQSNDSRCQELVTTLMEKSEVLKKAACDPAALFDVAKRLGGMPALSLIGKARDDGAIDKIIEEAVEGVQKLMSEYSTMDDFIGTHAEALKRIIDAGAEVTADLERELLGLTNASGGDIPGPGSLISLPKPSLSLSRDVSYGKRHDNDGHVIIETSVTNSQQHQPTFLENINDDNKTNAAIGPKFVSNRQKDALNLSGILNVLDGIVDTPGRMLVVTTNHPEMLDPALIRPGRIDKKLLLGFMSRDNLVSMVEHYFQTSVEQDQVKRLDAAISDGGLKLTPAQVEQMASEFEIVEEMVDEIVRKSRHVTLLEPHAKITRHSQIVYN